MIVQLKRSASTDEGTFGTITFKCQTLKTGELPWRENKRGLSCIPVGTYTVSLRSSPRYGTVYEVQDVEGRTYILMHHGNYCGDSLLDYRTDSDGCILFGKATGTLSGQKVVLSSKAARAHFEAVMGFKTFTLEITNE